MSLSSRLAELPMHGLGPANAVVADILHAETHSPALAAQMLAELIDACEDPRPLVTARAANALGKVQRKLPAEVALQSRRILRIAAGTTDLRTRWNIIEVTGRLPLKGRDLALAIDLLFEALQSPSGFLRAFALTGLVQHAKDDATLQRRLEPILQNAQEDPSAAVRARACEGSKSNLKRCNY